MSLVQRSNRGFTPKRYCDDHYYYSYRDDYYVDKVSKDSHLDNGNVRRNIPESNRKYSTGHDKIAYDIDSVKMANITYEDIAGLYSQLDSFKLTHSISRKGAQIISHDPDALNYYNNVEPLHRIETPLKNSYIIALEIFNEIDIVNLIIKILASSKDIWSLSPAKLAEDIERYYRIPLSKTVKRAIECMVISFAHEIWLTSEGKAIENTKDKKAKRAKEDKRLANTALNTDLISDDAYDIDHELKRSEDSSNYRFNDYYWNLPIAWRVPTAPIHCNKRINEINDIFIGVHPEERNSYKTLNLSCQGKTKELELSKQYSNLLSTIDKLIGGRDLDDEIRAKLRYIAVAITCQT